ncbi:hypothetical protein CC80DRAFT_490627 [Byssothecium circinans]|uniref:Uncharacterized protein n=1 Tax=Byssothecium circinans TaxID=147558 RepID=A0A6A5U4E8_9PLEO|nr:hypothetical protein CC80DRAFT_490627 [Byssothecium circinans]
MALPYNHALNQAIYFSPPPSNYADFTNTIQSAVSVLNTLTKASITAWTHFTAYRTAYHQLFSSESTLRQSIHDLVLSSDPNASTFERIKIEATFDEHLRVRGKEIFKVMQLEHQAVDAFEEVDGLREMGKSVCQELAHGFVLCERAKLEENKGLGGRLVLRVELGGAEKPLDEVRFQDGGGVAVEGMNLAVCTNHSHKVLYSSILMNVENARKLKSELERRMHIVRAHHHLCRIETTNDSLNFLALHEQTKDEIKMFREYFAEKDTDARAQFLEVLKKNSNEPEGTRLRKA